MRIEHLHQFYCFCEIYVQSKQQNVSLEKKYTIVWFRITN